MKLVKVNTFLLFIFNFILVLGQIPPKPNKIYPVIDYADMLSTSEEEFLNSKLINHYNNTSTEILIITINSLEGANENMVAAKIGEDWGIGEKEKDNGIVILVSKKDRKISIQNGYGTNIYLTAGIAKQIITNDITPYFKQGNYYNGIDNGINSIFQALAGKYNDKPKQEEEPSISPIAIFLIILIIIYFFSKSGNNKGNGNGGEKYRRHSGPSPIDIILSGTGRSSWGGSGGFGGGSSGGFGGFGGGGSFGGGGASGGW